MRLLLAALIAIALMLNGASRVVAQVEQGNAGESIVIAGTVITLCHFGKDADDPGKNHLDHSCDQCALRIVPVLPEVGAGPETVRFPYIIALRAPSSVIAPRRPARSEAWPRGPPAA